jgi:hypothetical protein
VKTYKGRKNKQPPTGSGVDENEPWPLFDSMSFMDQSIGGRDGQSSSADYQLKTEEDQQEEIIIENRATMDAEFTSPKSTMSTPTGNPKNKAKRKYNSSNEKEDDELMEIFRTSQVWRLK